MDSSVAITFPRTEVPERVARVLVRFALCNLCVLCASVVEILDHHFRHHRVTKN